MSLSIANGIGELLTLFSTSIKGIAGLAMTYGLNLNMIQARVIWNLCNMENKIISVERILQYTSIPSEPPLVTEENRLACSWPSHGEVDIQDLQVISIYIYARGLFMASSGQRNFHMFDDGECGCRSAMPHTCHLY